MIRIFIAAICAIIGGVLTASLITPYIGGAVSTGIYYNIVFFKQWYSK
jgi:hypothetical protein